MLTIRNITCIRNNKTLFTNLGLTIGDGCLTIIKGANGSGKSSLLQIIAGLLLPQQGSITYANEPVTQKHYHE